MEDDPAYEIEVTRQADPGDCDERRIREATELALRRHSCCKAQLSIALVDDAEIARLNAQFLGRTGPTDVLSFDLAEAHRQELDGQIVVSVETARRQAQQRGHSVEAESILYSLHGTLHQLGYDDAKAEDAERMHRVEDALLTELGFGAIYGTRSP